MGDRVVPAALEESQTSWRHGFLVFLVEIKSVEGPLGQLVAMRRWAAFVWEGADRQSWEVPGVHPACMWDCCQSQDLHQEGEGARATIPESWLEAQGTSRDVAYQGEGRASSEKLIGLSCLKSKKAKRWKPEPRAGKGGR